MVEAQRVRKEEAEMARHNANQALYQLVARVKDSADLVNILSGGGVAGLQFWRRKVRLKGCRLMMGHYRTPLRGLPQRMAM